MAVYSLTHFIVNISLPESMRELLTSKQKESLTIGGSGSFIESITIRTTTDNWQVKGDATGSYIHTFNADRTGEVELSISQVATQSKLFSKLMNIYFSKIDEKDGYRKLEAFPLIQVQDIKTGEIVAECKDAFIKKPAEKKYSSEAQNDTWIFAAGVVEYYPSK